MYKLKAIAWRGTLLSAAAVLVGGVVFPAVSVSADALNPLTERSLTLSSSSPGWSFTDGSGNTTYAPPHSGANGQKTGNIFSFKTSTDTTTATGTGSPITAMSFKYCDTSAGDCRAPGNNGYTDNGDGTFSRNSDSVADQTSDLKVAVDSSYENTDTGEINTFGTFIDASNGEVQQVPNRDGTQGYYAVYYKDGATWTQSTGWKVQVTNEEVGSVDAQTATGKDNYILLTNETGQEFAAETEVKVVFFGTDDNYITNPGAGEYYVRINMYDDFTAYTAPADPDPAVPASVSADNIVDGGVTVANVVNQSIQITTKVLETMQFSVGTVDPNTLDSTGDGNQFEQATGRTEHGVCDPIEMGMTPNDPQNVLQLGDQGAESSLAVDDTYITRSYWRLSSNSSAGATVYYSGVTLSNTVGDKIDAIGPNPEAPLEGSEQFGLAMANGTLGTGPYGPESVGGEVFDVDYDVATEDEEYANGADNEAAGLNQGAEENTQDIHPSTTTDTQDNASYHDPRLWPLIPEDTYDQGAGGVNVGSSSTQFAFDPTSNKIPVALADNDDQVVDCVTAKMRYIGNIAATTPAGIYTTKVNYIASPQY